MVKILREADRGDIAEVAKRHSISDQTIYIWRKKFGSMTPDDAKRLKALEGENAKLKKMLADKLLELEVMREINAQKW
jgi:putative transposase